MHTYSNRSVLKTIILMSVSTRSSVRPLRSWSRSYATAEKLFIAPAALDPRFRYHIYSHVSRNRLLNSNISIMSSNCLAGAGKPLSLSHNGSRYEINTLSVLPSKEDLQAFINRDRTSIHLLVVDADTYELTALCDDQENLIIVNHDIVICGVPGLPFRWERYSTADGLKSIVENTISCLTYTISAGAKVMRDQIVDHVLVLRRHMWPCEEFEVQAW